MQKQGTKHRFIISISYKVFVKHFTIFNFSQAQQQTLPNAFHCLELELYIYTFVCCIVSVVFLFVCFSFFACSFFCLCGYHYINASVSSTFVFMYFNFWVHLCPFTPFMFLWVGSLAL